MLQKLLFPLLALLLHSHLAAAQTPAWEIKNNCDVPSGSGQTLKSLSQEACQQACAGDAACKGFVHISGWKRCILRDDMKRQARLRFISGEKSEQGALESSGHRPDFDHSGKDLERKELDRVDQCAEACRDRKDCAAFTYLEGYRVCWLKAAGGRFHEKIFSCGIKK